MWSSSDVRGRRSGRRRAAGAVAVLALLCAAAACSSSGRTPPAGSVPSAPTTRASDAPTTGATTEAPSTDPTTAPTSGPPAAPPTTAPPADRTLRDLPITSASYDFVDPTRPTVTSGGVQVAPTRSLPTTVWYPATGGPWPLVVFGHGFQVGPQPYLRLCELWASAGYAVAVPSFPLTDQARAGAYLDEADIQNQPQDMRFLIGALLARSGQAGDPLAGLLDADRVGVAGHSDGASTALAVGYYPGLQDPRVKAVVALSADPLPNLPSATGTATLLDVHGDADTITPFANGEKVVDQIQVHRFFLVLHGADHLPPVVGGSPWTPVLDAVTLDFLDRYLAGRTADDDRLLADGGSQPALATLTSRS